MASTRNIRGISIEIGGDTTKLENSLKTVYQKSTDLTRKHADESHFVHQSLFSKSGRSVNVQKAEGRDSGFQRTIAPASN